MDIGALPEVVQFERFRLDRRARRLTRRTEDGQFEPVNIGSRAIAVLCTLVDHGGDLVAKEEIMAAVWPGQFVEEANLTVQISALRRALDQGRRGDSCIQTVTGRGYCLASSIERSDESSASAAPPGLLSSEPVAPPPRPRNKTIIASATALAALLIAGGWWLLRGNAPPTSIEIHRAQASDRRQSAIVLPIENGSGDPAEDDLAASLTRDLTDRLILSNLPVVPAMTASGYRGQSVDLQAIGQKYAVHFALMGNVRRQDGRVVSSANAYNIADGQPIWSRQFDLPDGPGVLPTLVQKIYEGYWQASLDAEVERAMHEHPERLDVRDLMNASLSTRLSALTKDNYVEKMSLVDRVLAIDPNDLQGLEREARYHAEFVNLGFSSDPAADLAIADKAADRLFAINPNSIFAMRAKATALRARGDWPGAEAVQRRAIELQPTEAGRHYELGFILIAEGRHREALQSFQDAKRFAGGADPLYLFDANIALAELAISQLAEAITMAQAAISESPPKTGRLTEVAWLVLIAATSEIGQSKEANAHLQKFLATPRSWDSMSKIRGWPAFAANPNLLNGLRNAGMPTND